MFTGDSLADERSVGTLLFADGGGKGFRTGVGVDAGDKSAAVSSILAVCSLVDGMPRSSDSDQQQYPAKARTADNGAS